jgi:hypothetical protein
LLHVAPRPSIWCDLLSKRRSSRVSPLTVNRHTSGVEKTGMGLGQQMVKHPARLVVPAQPVVQNHLAVSSAGDVVRLAMGVDLLQG